MSLSTRSPRTRTKTSKACITPPTAAAPNIRTSSKVAQIEADNEPAFNQAEAEFAKGNLTAASEDYHAGAYVILEQGLAETSGGCPAAGDFGQDRGFPWRGGRLRGNGSQGSNRRRGTKTRGCIGQARTARLGHHDRQPRLGRHATVETKMVLYPYSDRAAKQERRHRRRRFDIGRVEGMLHPACGGAQNPAANPGIWRRRPPTRGTTPPRCLPSRPKPIPP